VKLARDSLLNLIGLGAPLLLALVLMPQLVLGLGAERFGLLTLIWAVTSYFGLFDLGLSRALTHRLAQVLELEQHEDVGPLVTTALAMMALMGLAGGLLMALLAPWATEMIRQLTLPDEAVASTIVMGLTLPFIVVTAGLRGMLEACHAFRASNAIRLPMGLWTFAGPWLVMHLQGPGLMGITLALAAGRVFGFVAHLLCAWHLLPQWHGRLVWQGRWVRPMLVSGGWLTLSNVVSPFMGYVDRFVIGATISAAAVAAYATPQELITKLWIIPGAMTAVLFPAFAAQVAGRAQEAWRLFRDSVELLFWALWPVTLGLCLFARELLGAWISPAFALQSAPILQLFCMGILINCLAHVPLTWLQGRGAFRAPALLHLVELPLFLALLWGLCSRWGLMGAAVAWLLRMVGDAAGMFWLAMRGSGARPARQAALLATALLPFFGAFYAGQDDNVPARAVVWLTVLGLSARGFLQGLRRLRQEMT